MSSPIDGPVTWRSVIRLGLGFAAEYAMLALIEDAPVALKVATVVCATGALVTLKLEKWLKTISDLLFYSIIGILSTTYIGFIIFAVTTKELQSDTKRLAEQCYFDSDELTARNISDDQAKKSKDIDKLSSDFRSWEGKRADMLLSRAGEAARERFIDKSDMQAFIYGNDLRYSAIRNALAADRRNLAVLLNGSGFLN
jgi:hypothetical protein